MESRFQLHKEGKPVSQKWWTQFKLLLWKNYKVAYRNRKATLIQLSAPFIFVFILFLLQESVQRSSVFGDFYQDVPHQSEEPIGNIPLCINGPDLDHCWTFIYAPNNSSDVDQIVKMIREQNEPPIPADSVMSFSTAEDIDLFLYNNMNTTQGAYIFNFRDLENGTIKKNLSYIVQLNQTGYFRHGVAYMYSRYVSLPMVYAAERAILQWVSQNYSEPIDYEVTMEQFPHPQVLSVDIIGTEGPTWFLACIMFNFVVGLGQIVMEKEMKLRSIMQIMGLYDSVYWITWFITLSFFSTVSVILMIVSAIAFQFDFFLKNSFGLYFLLLELFALSMVSLTFLISTFVKRANQSTMIGFLVFILGFFMQLGANVVFSPSSPSSIPDLFSLFTPSLLAVGLTFLGQATANPNYPGLSWDSVNDKNVTGGLISFSQIYGWMILDFFLYLLLALYFDNVLPNVYGTSQPFYYFLNPRYWTGKVRSVGNKVSRHSMPVKEMVSVDEDVQAETEMVTTGRLPPNTAVIIDHLNKLYPGEWKHCHKEKPFQAVKDLCLSIQSDTLLCLLGPNGAGKTSTINMLVGLHEATSGDAKVFGYSIVDNLSDVQRILGVCPQFDILWNELTGEEHLFLFASLRDIDEQSIPGEVNRLLKETELLESRYLRSSMYSGGMKRRLSVAIALIGDPRIVFLDEPTTGMDPVSRRSVWNTIERAKKNKVIVLTTHSMEEADILGDKIAIMAHGWMKVVGTSLRLKQRFGAGYRITVGTSEDKLKEVENFFVQNIAKAHLHGTPIGGYMNFNVPRESSPELMPFFKKLEVNQKRLDIHDLQLSLTTLEEVFLTVAENAELEEIKGRMNNPSLSEATYPSEADIESQRMHSSSRMAQFKALFLKTATLQKRDTKTNICQCLTPFILVFVLFLFQQLVNYIVDFTSSPIDEVVYPLVTPPFHLLPRTVDDPTFLGSAASNPVIQRLNVTGTKLLYTSSMDLGNYTSREGFLGYVQPPFPMRFDNKFILFNQYGQLMNQTESEPNFPFFFQFESLPNKADMDNMLYNTFYDPPSIVGGYNFKQMNFTERLFHWSVIFNYTLGYSQEAPFLMNHISNAIAHTLAQPVILFLEGLKEYPTLANPDGFQVDIITLAGPFFYILVLNQLLPVFMASIVYEKESSIKDMLSMMGLKSEIYWIVHYLFDYGLYLCVMFFLIAAGYLFEFRVFTINTFGSYFILYLLWGHCLIAQALLMSVFFSTKKTAQIVGYFYILGVALACRVIVNNIVGAIDEVTPSDRFAISIVPPFALYRGLVYLADEVAFYGPGYSMSDLNDELVNMTSVYGFLVVEWLIMMLVWIYLQQVVPSGTGVKRHPLFFLGFKKAVSGEYMNEVTDQRLPSDVLEEKNRVFEDRGSSYRIKAMNLKKVYPGIDGNPPKVAVNGLSFGIGPNSCLGILGPNGAGKTTLIKMLIGLYEPTAGNAKICGLDLSEDLDTIYTFMGVCPQDNVLWDDLTGEEHLFFYGRIKNLKGKKLQEEVDSALMKVNLYDARNKLSRQYSGGMKRRLSVAISLIGSPKVLYLDEPSTGLDPKSRQDLWSVINQAKQTSSVILTTHSMEEADAICDRLMIMSEGEAQCIGVSADLKNRYGGGFKLSLQVARGEDDLPADRFVCSQIPQAKLMNNLAGTRSYEIPKNEVTLEFVFEIMEGNKERLKITDWAITNTTLEEVFLKIASINAHRKSDESDYDDAVVVTKNADGRNQRIINMKSEQESDDDDERSPLLVYVKK